MKPSEKINRLIKELHFSASAELDKKIHKEINKAVQDAGETRTAAQPNIWRAIMKSNITKLAVAAAIIILGFLLFHNYIGGTLESTAWAQVSECFASATFFKAAMYLKDSATDEPTQIEIWRNRNGKYRIRSGKQVAFGRAGMVNAAFDIDSRKKVKPDSLIQTLARHFGAMKEFSLETIISSFGADITDVTPKVNQSAIISKDLLVFDLTSERYHPEWIRVWALRNSKLPIRIRYWDPRDGECKDVFLTYAKQQQEIFFDPNEFEKQFKNTKGKDVTIAYIGLKDAGGRALFPAEPNDHKAFSTVTTTLDGKPWCLGNYRGKAILINFWRDKDERDRKILREAYEQYGNRDDFIIVEVSLLKDSEEAQRLVKKWNIEWTQLHEPGKGFDNSLAEAFGVDDTHNLWMVWKHGYIDKLIGKSMSHEKIEGAVKGFTYNSEIWLSQMLSHEIQRREKIDEEFVRLLCGEPDEIEDAENTKEFPGQGKVWVYRAYNSKKTKVHRMNVHFNTDGNVGLHSSNMWIDPSIIKIRISEHYLKNKLRAKLNPELQEQFDELFVIITLSSRTKGYPFNWKESFTTGRIYSRKVDPGTYQLAARLLKEKDNYDGAQYIPLDRQIEVERGQEIMVEFE